MFQGGSFDPPGGLGFDQCSILLNMEFERVFYKNNYAAGVTIFNLYMVARISLLMTDDLLGLTGGTHRFLEARTGATLVTQVYVNLLIAKVIS